MHENRIKTAIKIQEIVKHHYETGRQDRCKLWIFRNIIQKDYPMGVATFFRYLKIAKLQTINNQ